MEFLYPNHGSEMMCFVLMNGKIIEVSEALITETGYDKKDFIFKDLKEAFIILRGNINFENIDNFEENRDYFIFNKSSGFIKVKIHNIKHPHINYNKVIFTKANDDSIRNTINFLNQLYKDSMINAAAYSAPDLSLIYANSSYIINNCVYDNKEEYLGKNIYELISDFSGNNIAQSLLEVLNTRKTVHLSRCVRLDSDGLPTYWDVTLAPAFHMGKIEYIIETSAEVTESVMDKFLINEQKNIIHQSNELLEAIFQNVPIGLSVIDKEGKKIKENKYSKKMFSNFPLSGEIDKVIERGCCFHKNGSEFKYEEFPSVRIIRGEKFHNSLMMIKKDGENTYLRFSGDAIFNQQGQFQMGILCVWDVTKSMKYNDLQLKQKDVLISNEISRNDDLKKTLKEQEEFFSNISHEFKTPINMILASLQVMGLFSEEETSKFNPQAMRKYSKIIKLNSYRLLRIVNNLMDISEINLSNFQLGITENNIVELLEDTSFLAVDYANKKGVDIIFDTNVEEYVIGCAPDILERILLNLLSNALKFTSQGDNIMVTLKKMEDCFSISVKDTGIGISEENMNSIFDRFNQVDKSFTRANEGSGLGLTIVKALVRVYGGNISVVSEFGVGSEFIVTLPVKYNYSKENSNINTDVKNRVERIKIEFSDIY